MKKLILLFTTLSLLAGMAIWQRHRIIFALSSSGEPPPLADSRDAYPAEYWVDDYYVVVMLDERSFAIGEPRNPQQNYNYLLLGQERAVLFDAGTGHYNIRAVAESLTTLPITFIPSHFHYDHVGNSVIFDRVALVDLPHVRERVKENRLQLRWREHLGSTEGIDAPELVVNEWLKPGSTIELGGRGLRVLYTPGHTDDSISLLDTASSTLFSGDFLYPGSLFAFMPNSNLGDYLRAAEAILANLDQDTTFYGAHGGPDGGLPKLALSDVSDLREQLLGIQRGSAEGSGSYPVAYLINSKLELLAEPGWLQKWDPRYPELIDRL